MRKLLSLLLVSASIGVSALCPADEANAARPPKSEDDLRFWMQNMVWHHRFTGAEIRAATGFEEAAIEATLRRLAISSTNRPARATNAPLLVLPYPGGRHPRIGFLDGAVDPQRETKVSVFTPWDEASYVVCDFPEAVWSNLGLTYLAHTHVPTVWTKAGTRLEPTEWNRRADGTYDMERTLPNGIRFGTRVVPGREAVRFGMWLVNGTPETLSDLRVQNCVMLKGATGFKTQSNTNKVIRAPYVAAHSEDGKRWVISAWEPNHHPWANPPVPCLHSDPKFPDCAPGETKQLRGWLSFFEGVDVQAEFTRLDSTGWRTAATWP